VTYTRGDPLAAAGDSDPPSLGPGLAHPPAMIPGGWKVNSELPGPSAFESASQFVREEDVAESIPCGDSVEAVVQAVKEFADAGFTHVALCQIGGDNQSSFIEWWNRELGPALVA
jgi:hypothetical protein